MCMEMLKKNPPNVNMELINLILCMFMEMLRKKNPPNVNMELINLIIL